MEMVVMAEKRKILTILLGWLILIMLLPVSTQAAIATDADYFKTYNSYQDFFSTEKCDPWTWDQLMVLKNRASATLTMGENYYLYAYDINRTGYMTKIKMLYQYIRPDGTQGNAFTLAELDNGTQFNMVGLDSALSFVNPGQYVIITSITFADGSSLNGLAFSLYTVTYDANGGSSAPKGQLKRYGKSLEIAKDVPVRTGYTFLGWSTDPNATKAEYKAGNRYSTEKVLKLYAVWKKNSYTISYDANGGSGTPAAQTKSYGTTMFLTNSQPVRTGYDFLGWAEDPMATYPSWKSGNSFSEDKNTTLYAVWKEKEYQISYNSNGGSGAPAGQTKKYTEPLTLSSNVPERNGYLFQGWSRNIQSETAEYTPGEVIRTNENITLYAVWKKAPEPVTEDPGTTPGQGNSGNNQTPSQSESGSNPTPGLNNTTNNQSPAQNGTGQSTGQTGTTNSQISELKKYAPKKMTLSVKSKKKRTITISWKRNKSVSGYELQYSTSKKFPAQKSKTKNGYTSSNKTTSSTVRGLKSKKTYYVRIRAYKKVKGIRVSGAWSKVRKIKVK